MNSFPPIFNNIDPVLIVENDPIILDLMKSHFEQSDIIHQSVNHPKEALELIKNKSFSIFIVNMHLPLIGEKLFIEKIKEVLPDSIVVVRLSQEDKNTLYELLKFHVFEFLITPFDKDNFLKVIFKSLEYSEMKESNKLDSPNSSDINNSNIKTKEYIGKIEQKLFTISNLHTSLAQGGGLGTLVTMVDLLKSTVVKTNGNYLVDAEIIDVLFENNEFCKKQINSMMDFSILLTSNLALFPKSLIDIMKDIQSIPVKFETILKNKNIQVKIDPVKNNINLEIQKESMLTVFEELIINAFKYSPTNSTILITYSINDKFLILKFINDVIENPSTGIPKEYERLVTEPFFRLVQYVDESVLNIEKYSIGLGLAYVDCIVHKQNGFFKIQEFIDPTNSTKKILAEIILPIH